LFDLIQLMDMKQGSCIHDQITRLYKEGKSMREVAELCGISLNKVTYALRKHRVPRRSAREARAYAFIAKQPSFTVREDISTEINTIGAMLYWAEGYKTKLASGVDFANSDVRMASLFIHFLRSRYTLDESRFRVLLYCHTPQEPNELITFWSKMLSIPERQFTKPYIRTSGSGARTVPFGTIHIRYNDKKMLNDILNLIHSISRKYPLEDI
jgi:hypothetical protein